MDMRRKIKTLIVVGALILVGFAIYGGLQMLESSVFHKETDVVDQETSKTVTKDGIDYFPRQDITTLLILGIDETGPVQDSMSYNNEGESDVVLLVIFDETNEK